MNRRTFIISISAALLSAIVLSVVLFREPSEPTYHGRPLSEWLWPDPEHLVSMHEALDNMGTNTFPFMLKWIRQYPREERLLLRATKKPNRYFAKLPPWLRALLPNNRLTRNELAGRAAMFGFGHYKQQAACTVPELLDMADHTNQWANMALESMGAGIMPQLYTGLTNGSPTARDMVFSYMQRAGSAGEIETVLPMLEDLVVAKDEASAHEAIWLLAHHGLHQPELSVPILCKAMDDERPGVRSTAMFALAGFGPKASPALTKVWNYIYDSDRQVRAAAQALLAAIGTEEKKQ